MIEFRVFRAVRQSWKRNGFAVSILTVLRSLPRGSIAFWILTSCLLLVLAVALQLRWMRDSNESQRLWVQHSLAKSMSLAVEDLEYKVWLLLGLFRPDPASELVTPVNHYIQQLYSWHELSQNGPAIQRVLVYDTGAEDSNSLAELELVPGLEGLKSANWDKDLVQARQYIQEHGFPPDRGVSERSTATWMFHPGAMLFMRPIVGHVPSSGRQNQLPRATGYLILKLDPRYICERLIPNSLNRSFGSGPGSHAYTIDFALDGNPLLRFEPVKQGDADVRYSRVHLSEPDALAQGRPPDKTHPVLLSQLNEKEDQVPPSGAVQRVLVNKYHGTWWLDRGGITRPGSIWWDLYVRRTPELRLGNVLREWAGIPRLYVIGSEKHLLHLEARHVGIPLVSAINLEHSRLRTVAGISLVLFLGATVMVAVLRSIVARTAELRTDAAASLAHQLFTPITAISSIGENISRGILGQGAKTVEYGALIHRYGQRLQTIVERAMQMFAMNAFERRYDLKMLDVSRVTEEALNDLRFVIEDAGFTTEHALGKDLPEVRADEEALQQAIADLIGNAVKYGHSGRWLKVETMLGFAGPGQEVLIRVHDRGPGIAAREASKIFEPYYRIDNRITKSRPGAGLGLKLVVEMVKGMGGSVKLESEEGKGSVFTIHLPVPAS